MIFIDGGKQKNFGANHEIKFWWPVAKNDNLKQQKISNSWSSSCNSVSFANAVYRELSFWLMISFYIYLFFENWFSLYYITWWLHDSSVFYFDPYVFYLVSFFCYISLCVWRRLLREGFLFGYVHCSAYFFSNALHLVLYGLSKILKRSLKQTFFAVFLSWKLNASF